MDIENSLSMLPNKLKSSLVASFNEVEKGFFISDWEKVLVSSGKLCECAYSILDAICSNAPFPSDAIKPKNFYGACKRLEEKGDKTLRSARITIPRVLCAVYELRNNRGGGHAGSFDKTIKGDAYYCRASCRWIMSNLIVILNSNAECNPFCVAEFLCDGFFPIVWSTGDTKRISITGLSRKEQVLVLLAGEEEPVAESDLLRWLEQTNKSAFRRDVIRPLHKSKFINYDQDSKTVSLMPLGIKEASRIAMDKMNL